MPIETDAETIIARSIERGSTQALANLSTVERLVYLISEAEVLCDMEGIDSFICAYGLAGVGELAHAYELVGAARIAIALRKVLSHMPKPPDDLLTEASTLITERSGYAYHDIVTAVFRSLERAPETIPLQPSPGLWRFFSGYFHQDWAEDDAGWGDVVGRYRRDAGDQRANEVAAEIRSLLAQEPSDLNLAKRLFEELGCYHDPGSADDGLTARGWLKEVADGLEGRAV